MIRLRTVTSVRMTLAIGVLVVTTASLFAVFNLFGWARVADLRYPVIALRADGSHAFAVSRSELLTRPATDCADAPEDGAILIDADFRIYEERNVRRPQSDVGWLVRRYTSRMRPPAYKMDLRRRWRSGLPRVQAELARCRSFASGEDAELVHEELLRQTTLPGLVAIVNRNVVEPPEALVQTTQDAPATRELEAGNR